MIDCGDAARHLALFLIGKKSAEVKEMFLFHMPLHIAACDPWSYGTCPTPERGLKGATGSPVELKNKKRVIQGL